MKVILVGLWPGIFLICHHRPSWLTLAWHGQFHQDTEERGKPLLIIRQFNAQTYSISLTESLLILFSHSQPFALIQGGDGYQFANLQYGKVSRQARLQYSLGDYYCYTMLCTQAHKTQLIDIVMQKRHIQTMHPPTEEASRYSLCCQPFPYPTH